MATLSEIVVVQRTPLYTYNTHSTRVTRVYNVVRVQYIHVHVKINSTCSLFSSLRYMYT